MTYCAEVVAATYTAMGLLDGRLPTNYYDPGMFWSGRRPAPRARRRGSARRSGSSVDSEGQPQLSQTPVAGMAMLQVGQTCPSEPRPGRTDAPAHARAGRPTSARTRPGLATVVGDVRAEGR